MALTVHWKHSGDGSLIFLMQPMTLSWKNSITGYLDQKAASQRETNKQVKTMTVEFFGFPKVGQTGTYNHSSKVENTEAMEKTEQSGKSTSFYSTLQGASKLQAESVYNSERTARIEELKTQVADGTYEPDLEKVASSLLKFLVEG